MRGRAWFTVDYDDGKQSTYQAFVVKYTNAEGKEVERRFATGNPIIDYMDYKLWLARDSVQELIFTVGKSSSFDHFFMDGDRYKSLHVYFEEATEEGGQPLIESYDNEEVMKLPRKKFDKLQEYVTKHPYKTFEQLKAYYRWKKNIPKDQESLFVEAGVDDPVNEFPAPVPA